MLTNQPIQFDKWVPDNTFWNQKSLSDCKNVFPQANGYGPIPALAGDGSAIDASLRARGSKTFRLNDSTVETLAAVKDDILHLQLDGSWTSIGDATFSTDASSGFWSFTQFGTLAIAVNGVDVPRKWDFTTTPANTSALGGSPPVARYAATFFDFVVLGNLDTEESSVHWSGINDAEGWTVGTNSSDKQQFPDGGRVTGLHGGQRLIVMQERKIRMGQFAPGSPEIIQFDIISEERGCTAYRGSAQIGQVIFFVSDDGFFMIEGAGVVPISDEIVARWYRDNSRSDMRTRTICSIDRTRRVVMWSFFSVDNQIANADESVPDMTIIYHWPTKKWAYAEFGIEAPLDISVTPLGLDDLDSFGTLDALTSSLDSGVFNSELLGSSFAAFDSSRTLATFSGDNMEACFALPRQQFFVPNRQIINGVMPITDAANFEVALTPRKNLNSASATTSYVSNEDSGWCPHHSSARMHDILVKIPAAENWEFINGVFVSREQDGEL